MSCSWTVCLVCRFQTDSATTSEPSGAKAATIGQVHSASSETFSIEQDSGIENSIASILTVFVAQEALRESWAMLDGVSVPRHTRRVARNGVQEVMYKFLARLFSF